MNKLIRLLLGLMTLMVLALPADAKKPQKPRVEFQTTMGTFVVTLFNETPLHRDNFLKLVREGYYDGLLFHRVIRDFMVQTGDPDSREAPAGKRLGEGGPGYTLPAEIDPFLYHWRGAVAAAREPDNVNPERRSSGSQFYIVWGKVQTPEDLSAVNEVIKENTNGATEITPERYQVYRSQGGTPHLDGQFTVFGEVTSGLKVIKKMQAVKTDRNDRPLEDVRIVKARVLEP